MDVGINYSGINYSGINYSGMDVGINECESIRLSYDMNVWYDGL